MVAFPSFNMALTGTLPPLTEVDAEKIKFVAKTANVNFVIARQMLEKREAVQRGRIVNRSWGEEWEQVPERHSAQDIDKVIKQRP